MFPLHGERRRWILRRDNKIPAGIVLIIIYFVYFSQLILVLTKQRKFTMNRMNLMRSTQQRIFGSGKAGRLTRKTGRKSFLFHKLVKTVTALLGTCVAALVPVIKSSI